MTSNNSEIPADTADAILEELRTANLIAYTAAFGDTLPSDTVVRLHDDIAGKLNLNTRAKSGINGVRIVNTKPGKR